MSKPTNQQQEFCENLMSLLKDNCNTWITTNDIDSPSHYTLIGESVEIKINFTLTEKQESALKEAIDNIYDIVKTIKS